MAAIFERVIFKKMDCHGKRPPTFFSDYFIIFSNSDGTEQGLRAGQNIRTRGKKFSMVRTEHWSEHQNILNKILIEYSIF